MEQKTGVSLSATRAVRFTPRDDRREFDPWEERRPLPLLSQSSVVLGLHPESRGKDPLNRRLDCVPLLRSRCLLYLSSCLKHRLLLRGMRSRLLEAEPPSWAEADSHQDRQDRHREHQPPRRHPGQSQGYLLVVEESLYVEFGRKVGQDSLISGT
jgi:hypothetical protein